MEQIGYNKTFPIYNADGTPFNGLVMKKATFNSVVMGLGDKITGEVLYRDNNLAVTMQEYIEYKRDGESDTVKYVLVNPPTIVKEGLVSDNGDIKGLVKYSFEFYHPMYMLSNFPFTDVAVSDDEKLYLAADKTFSWIGRLKDFADKLNKNLQSTDWVVVLNEESIGDEKLDVLSDVLSFDNNYISDALKTAYETWEVPFIIDVLHAGEYSDDKGNDYYAAGKKFVILFGLPSNEIIGENREPYVFKCGKGLGLKNNSRTPKNNKIVTRISGYGSEENIPFGYPQIIWHGNQEWDYTINNEPGVHEITTPSGKTVMAQSYPIYKGIVGGRYVKLIKHPFTRTHLMPSIYVGCVTNKVSQYLAPLPGSSDLIANPHFDPEIDIIDYYDADTPEYPHQIVLSAPSFEIHEFDKVKPELVEANLENNAEPYNDEKKYVGTLYKQSEFEAYIREGISSSNNEKEKAWLQEILDVYLAAETWKTYIEDNGSYIFYTYIERLDQYHVNVTHHSSEESFKITVLLAEEEPPAEWNDTIDEDGKIQQSYFKLTLPPLGFDVYACAAIPQAMSINMRSGSCIGCTFNVMVDWEDYKKNFYNADGDFDPIIHTQADDGHVRNGEKYPDSTSQSVTLIVQKDTETFGTILPDIYRQPKEGDQFVILGISLPQQYVDSAQQRLDGDMKEYMLENNVYYYDYPLKVDEKFLKENPIILTQIRNNAIFRFQFGNETPNALYIKEMTIKFGEGVFPQYDITLTDDVEIVLNQIGQTTDDVSRLRVQVGELQEYYNKNVLEEIRSRLSKISDDVAQGRITFQQGFNSLGRALFNDDLSSPDFVPGLYEGHGWRIDRAGNAEFESVRARAFLEVVELIINRLQAQEGDTAFTDNDQIDFVQKREPVGASPYYIVSLKEKWEGYVTSQKIGNILKGVINTIAAKKGGVSDVEDGAQGTVLDGANSYYTSWMVVIDPVSVGETLDTNQIAVRLWGDNEGSPAGVPSGVNFEPCELMTLARWGCLGNSQDPLLTPAQKADIERRQRTFYISTTDGRISKLRGVNQPILKEENYGTTLGVIPDFINNWTIASRLMPARDYLYAQGVIVGDFIKVDSNGDPLSNFVDCGEWVDGGNISSPTVGHGIYLVGEYNEESLQWETHDVWHKGAKWRCLTHQPIPTMSGYIYAEPSDDSPYWKKLLSSAEDVRENLLRQTAFIDTTLSSWYTHIGEIVEQELDGRNAFKGTNTSASTYLDFLQQQVYGADKNVISPNTVYTLSFWAKGNSSFEVHLYPSMVHSSSATIVDGVEQLAGTNFALFSSSADYSFHTIEFKTAASITGGQYILFRILKGIGNTTSICMPKLERGRNATAYMENELDLQGKRGRTPYYCGTWEDFTSDSTNTFNVTDAETPYFSKLRSGSDTIRDYWVFVGANSPSGGYSAADVGTPSNTNANWQIMVSDFKYLITEAVFSAFAKLGSAIFNGDFMYSQWGYRNGQLVHDGWGHFDPLHPDDDTNFNPNIFIDWKKGSVQFGAGKSAFNSDGSGHLADGNIAWDADGNARFEGDITAHSGIFSGFLKKTATLITSTNRTEYLEDTTIAQRKTFNLDKAGSFLVFEPQWYAGSGLAGVDIKIPSLKIPTAYSSSNLSSIAYVGTILILVAHGDQIPIKLFVEADSYGGSVFLNPKTGVTSKELWLQSLSQTDPTYGKDSITFLECKMGVNYGVYWEYRQINITKPI